MSDSRYAEELSAQKFNTRALILQVYFMRTPRILYMLIHGTQKNFPSNVGGIFFDGNTSTTENQAVTDDDRARRTTRDAESVGLFSLVTFFCAKRK